MKNLPGGQELSSARDGRKRDSGGVAFSLAPLASTAEAEAIWRAGEAAHKPSFFLSWAWMGTFLATLPPEVTFHLMTAKRGGAVVGHALLGRHSIRQKLRAPATGLHLNASGDDRWDCIAIEHNGFLAPAGSDVMLIPALSEWFAAGGAGELADELRLPGIAAALNTGMLDGLKLLHSTQFRPGFTVDLAKLRSGGGDFTKLISSNARQQLRRAQRDYGGPEKLRVTEAGSLAEAKDYFAAMKALHVASWERRGQRHAFSAPYFERFHTALMEREFANGKVQVLHIASASDTIGYLYNFRHEGRIYAYQSGFEDADPKRRPGALSHALAIEHNARQGEAIYDFLAGENQLKASYGSDRYELAWQIVRLPKLKYRIESAARRIKQRLIGPREVP